MDGKLVPKQRAELANDNGYPTSLNKSDWADTSLRITKHCY